MKHIKKTTTTKPVLAAGNGWQDELQKLLDALACRIAPDKEKCAAA